MEHTDLTTTITVHKTPAEVFDAICQVRNWWHGEIEGSAGKPGDEFSYRMKELHFSRQKVVEWIPGKKIVWLVTDSTLNFISDKSEWTGTEITFEISETGNGTQLRFTHRGLLPAAECYSACSNGWSKLIQQSLFGLITAGAGKAVF